MRNAREVRHLLNIELGVSGVLMHSPMTICVSLNYIDISGELWDKVLHWACDDESVQACGQHHLAFPRATYIRHYKVT